MSQHKKRPLGQGKHSKSAKNCTLSHVPRTRARDVGQKRDRDYRPCPNCRERT
jgi:hypothetical protein